MILTLTKRRVSERQKKKEARLGEGKSSEKRKRRLKERLGRCIIPIVTPPISAQGKLQNIILSKEADRGEQKIT